MMETENRSIMFWVSRVVIYAILIAFGLFMLFPFIYMVSSSLKTPNDVFNVPPRLLPYTPVQREFNGAMVNVYQLEVDGQMREMVITGEKLAHIFFTTEEQINIENVRSSPLVIALPRDQVEAGVGAVPTGEQIARTDAAGRENQFDVYTVEVNGQPQRLVEVYRGSMDQFVDPTDPAVITYAFERTARKLEYVDFKICNYNTVFAVQFERLIGLSLGQDACAYNANVQLNLSRSLVNTTVVTVAVVVGQLITSIFGGYAFSRVQFRGRDTLFVLYLGSIMIPFVVLIIPMYRLMVVIEWQNRLVSLILPWIFTAYGTFLMRQFFVSIPKEIEEAALLDGASRLRVLWGIFVPLSTPAIATLAIFSFLYAWNSFLWPLLIIGEGMEQNHVLTLSLIRLSNSFADQPNLVLTGAAVAILPPVIVFILAQKYFIEGVTSSGVKG